MDDPLRPLPRPFLGSSRWPNIALLLSLIRPIARSYTLYTRDNLEGYPIERGDTDGKLRGK